MEKISFYVICKVKTMIDFKQKRFLGVCHDRMENLEVLEKYAATIRKDLEDSKQNFFWLGVHLIDLYSSNTYSVIVGVRFNHERIRNEYGFNVPIGAGNCCADFFFAYCFDEFGLDKTQVSRLMNIVDEFGDGLRCFKKEWEKFGYSQLCELLPLSDEERKPVKPDWTVKKIREYKKSLSDKPPEATDDQTPEAEEPPKDKYARFEKWTKRELCDKIFDLEAQYDELLRENERLLHLSIQEMAG